MAESKKLPVEEILSQLEELKNSKILPVLNKRFSPKKQIQQLKEEDDDFYDYNKHVRKVKQLAKKVTSEINIFRIIQSRSTENKISDFYGWLFNPKESHSIGKNFLESFLEIVFENNDEKLYSDYSFNLAQTKVHLRPQKEKGELDFEIDIPRENEGNFGCIVESKFGAEEGDEQLWKYREYAERNYDESLLVFLTKEGSREITSEEPGKDNEWVQISHWDILDILKNGELIRVKGNLNDETKNLVKRFRDYLELKLMDDDLRKKCRKLWEDENYKNGLEKLVEYGLMKEFHEALEDRLKDEDWFKNYKFRAKGFRPIKKIELWKEKWSPDSFKSRLFFKVNPRDPSSGKIALKIHHNDVTQEDGGFMNEKEHSEFEKEIIDKSPEEFNPSDQKYQYIMTFCDRDFKPENYLSILEWTVENLRILDDKYSEIIDEAIDKSINN